MCFMATLHLGSAYGCTCSGSQTSTFDLAGKVGKGIKQRTAAAKAHQFKNVLLSFQYALQRSADDTFEEIHPQAGWKTPTS